MNNKGQALIEFVLILPVFLFILFVIIDFSMIFSFKLKLEDDCEDIVMLIKDGKSVSDVSNIYDDLKIDIREYKDDFLRVSVSGDVNIITPGLDRIFGNPYNVSIERVIARET